MKRRCVNERGEDDDCVVAREALVQADWGRNHGEPASRELEQPETGEATGPRKYPVLRGLPVLLYDSAVTQAWRHTDREVMRQH